MSFNIQNTTLNNAVEESLINTDEQIGTLSYTPVWTYNTSVTSPGNFAIDFSGYKVVNVIDSNGINIKYWLNTLNTCIIASTYIGLSTYVTGVDGESGINRFIQSLSSVIDNGNGTYTITGGDVYASGSWDTGTKYYMSYITK